MEKFENTEALLAWIVDFFAVNFGNSAILKGGMSLRLMHSPRYTNDVDYIFVPFGSKKNAKSLVEGALSHVEGLRFESTMNSKALRILVEYGGQQAQGVSFHSDVLIATCSTVWTPGPDCSHHGAGSVFRTQDCRMERTRADARFV